MTTKFVKIAPDMFHVVVDNITVGVLHKSLVWNNYWRAIMNDRSISIPNRAKLLDLQFELLKVLKP